MVFNEHALLLTSKLYLVNEHASATQQQSHLVRRCRTSKNAKRRTSNSIITFRMKKHFFLDIFLKFGITYITNILKEIGTYVAMGMRVLFAHREFL